MKRYLWVIEIFSILTIFSATIFLVSCDGGGGGDGIDEKSGSNTDPTAYITKPTDGSLYTEGDIITFSGSGSDTENGILTGISLVWTSNIDSQIGTGTSFTTSNLSGGIHTITLIATDSDGGTGTDSVSITINPELIENPGKYNSGLWDIDTWGE